MLFHNYVWEVFLLKPPVDSCDIKGIFVWIVLVKYWTKNTFNAFRMTKKLCDPWTKLWSTFFTNDSCLFRGFCWLWGKSRMSQQQSKKVLFPCLSELSGISRVTYTSTCSPALLSCQHIIHVRFTSSPLMEEKHARLERRRRRNAVLPHSHRVFTRLVGEEKQRRGG